MMLFWVYFIPIISLTAIVFFSKLKVLFKTKESHRIEDEEADTCSQNEFNNTLINLIVFLVIGLITDILTSTEWLNIYFNVRMNILEISYLIASFFIALGIHDLYFYVSHRILHIGPVFRTVHFIHHKSHSVNPWSAFSFHPLEGVLQIAIIPIVPMIIPIHFGVLIGFSTFLLFMTVYGHSGYELRHKKPKVFQIFNTSYHHYAHHKYVRWNYGIYLNLWDKLFHTIDPKFEESFQALSERIEKKKFNPDRNHVE